MLLLNSFSEAGQDVFFSTGGLTGATSDDGFLGACYKVGQQTSTRISSRGWVGRVYKITCSTTDVGKVNILSNRLADNPDPWFVQRVDTASFPLVNTLVSSEGTSLKNMQYRSLWHGESGTRDGFPSVFAVSIWERAYQHRGVAPGSSGYAIRVVTGDLSGAGSSGRLTLTCLYTTTSRKVTLDDHGEHNDVHIAYCPRVQGEGLFMLEFTCESSCEWLAQSVHVGPVSSQVSTDIKKTVLPYIALTWDSNRDGSFWLDTNDDASHKGLPWSRGSQVLGLWSVVKPSN
eukprot:TRINITY_DN3566_c0_g1_i1.p1 TRINITY_DN3566_c0_g1~~TRINITY_DN3566_c0_g1_i1.p1  ORF type:complete len:320 (+),score=7.07 TRINITY_DN3566_c0_g1_i1:98-961(+)